MSDGPEPCSISSKNSATVLSGLSAESAEGGADAMDSIMHQQSHARANTRASLVSEWRKHGSLALPDVEVL